MKYRTARKLILGMWLTALVLALSLLVIQNYTWIIAAVPLIVILIGACYVIKFVFCKCPNCGGYLRHYYPYCPHCGSAIDEND